MVTMVYRTVLRRAPDPEGFALNVDALKNGHSLEDLLRGALNSKEYRDSVYWAVRSGTWSPMSPVPQIPDGEFYVPLFSPWAGYGEFSKFYQLAKDKTVVTLVSCHVLYQLALQALNVRGEFWECGVFKGGTAAMLAQIISEKSKDHKKLCLFDTFTGMPDTDQVKDRHRRGDFADTSLIAVREFVRHDDLVSYYPGFIPDTFRGLENSIIAFAHVDVDIYRSVLDCCQFIYPRLSLGGFIIFDDYGIPSCPGARTAVDEYFRDSEIQPLVLPSGQAIVFKSEFNNSLIRPSG
jgi:O-methyltransferase